MSSWLDDAVFYEVYPQSFQDSNADGIGDFPGLISRLDYIKDLGCNAIWINPCFVSPFGDAGYDVADYYSIAPRYGTNEDAKHLFAEAHKRGMHILFDLVPGHTSVEHPWFKESMKAEKNEFTDRYVWTDNIWTTPEGMATIRGISSRNGSAVVNFFSSQPALNYGFYEKNADWQQSMEDEGPRATLEAMEDVVRFWLTAGCDGFRVDMAGSLVKNDPKQEGTIALWKKVRKFLDDEFPEAVLISEWGEPDKSLRGGFHMDFLLHFGPSHYNDLFRVEHPFFSKEGKGDISQFVSKYKENYEKTDKKGLICIPSGNHDMERISLRLDEEDLKIAYAFLFSMPGAPFLYYGDEIGMKYVEGLISVEGGYDRTGARTPMQWDDGVNAGFSMAPKEKLYIRQDESRNRPTVAEQMKDPDSIFHEVKRLIALRRVHPALGNLGEISFVYAKEQTYPFVYLRSSADEKILVVLNPSEREASFSYAGALGEVIYQHGGELVKEDGRIRVSERTACFVKVE